MLLVPFAFGHILQNKIWSHRRLVSDQIRMGLNLLFFFYFPSNMHDLHLTEILRDSNLVQKGCLIIGILDPVANY